MNLKKFFTVIILLFLCLFGVVVFMVCRYAESCDKMVNNWWEVKKIVINGEDMTKDFSNLNFLLSYSKRHPIGLPFNESEGAKNTNKKNNWDYYRSGLFEGNIVIYDNKQEILSGDYQIEIIDYRTPQGIKLYSDSITFYLYEETLTLGNPTKINW